MIKKETIICRDLCNKLSTELVNNVHTVMLNPKTQGEVMVWYAEKEK